jgi:hypothetical protein
MTFYYHQIIRNVAGLDNVVIHAKQRRLQNGEEALTVQEHYVTHVDFVRY